MTPETPALKSEVLPKSLRVPPGLEDYMKAVKLGGEWSVQCMLCAGNGKQFYMANVGDMISHIQSVHNELRSLTSSVKAEAELKPEDIQSLVRLDNPEKGTCVVCGARTILEFCITKHNGEWGFLCGDCSPGTFRLPRREGG